MTPTAIIFTRCSSSGSLEGRQDTTRQVEDLQHYADSNHIQVIRNFQEHQSGGLSNKCRPLLQEALSFCIDNHIDLILCSELSRLSRKCDELLETIKSLKDHHINCYFLKEQLSIFSPDGKENPYLTIMCAVLAQQQNWKGRPSSIGSTLEGRSISGMVANWGSPRVQA